MSDQTEKRCVACDKSISAAAKKCAYCHSWQSAWGIQSSTSLALIAVFIAFGFIGMRYLRNQENSNVSYSHFQGPISVIDSEVRLSTETTENKDPRWYSTVTIGHIKNNTDIAWKKIRFEIQFFNKSGKMIDSTARMNDDLLLPPHENVSFKVLGTPVRDKEEYVSHKVYIRWAERSK